MGHYRGWTILVSLDSIDEDWSALAVKKLCYSHPQFMVANEDQNNTAIGLSEWLPTKEDAYATIKSKIDSIFENNNGDI
jgi:hypothetical protein